MKKSNFLFSALLVGTMGLVSCAGGSSHASKSASPGAVIEKAYKLMGDKKYDKVAELYLSGDGQKLTGEESKKMEGLVGMAAAQHAKKGGIKEVVVVEENIEDSGNAARVKYTIVYNDGSESNEKVSLQKTDGHWFMMLKMN